MPWRLIEFAIIFGLFVVFIAFNLGNKCDINLIGFKKFTDVPVFLTAFSAFFFGLLCAVPFVIGARSKRKAGKDAACKAGVAPPKPKKGKKGKDAVPTGKSDSTKNTLSTENSFSDDGPYGIN